MSATSTRGAVQSHAPAQVLASSPAALRLRRPSWRDRRFVVGLVLVLGATVLGAHLLAAPDRGASVWVARHDLAAGLPLRPDDLEARVVDLPGLAARYVSSAAPLPSGVVLTRAIGAGDLLPADAVSTGGANTSADMRAVTVPVEQFHVASSLARGDRVDVYVTPTSDTGSGIAGSAGSAPTSAMVASGVDVLDVEETDGRFGGGSDTIGVVVAVPAGQVARMVGGLSHGTVDIVRGADPANAADAAGSDGGT